MICIKKYGFRRCYHRKCTYDIISCNTLRRCATLVTILSLMVCLCALTSSTGVDAFTSWSTDGRLKFQKKIYSSTRQLPLLQPPCCYGPRQNSKGKRRSGYTSPSFICWSTISEETVTNTSFQINGASNNGASNGVVLNNGASQNDGHVNGASSNGVSLNGMHVDTTHNGQQTVNMNEKPSEEDVPLPTVNGGYTHTSASKAKISAANKGKTPWNKGKTRSEEVKARIAEGVRRRNRERFLAKLAEEGITEEEFNERKKAERRKKDAERRARKTAKGGYTPTEETKKKISHILKTKYANGEIKRRPRDPSTIRKGFKHSEETKQKIRETLKRKWAEDSEYRELMTNKTVASGELGVTVRKRIAETLKKKWEDPEFRESMMEKFKNRKKSSASRDKAHREKISAAMKKKWMDEEYRKRATEGMAKGRDRMSNTVSAVKPVQPKMPRKKKATNGELLSVQPLKKKAKTTVKREKKAASVKKKSTSKVNGDSLTAVEPILASSKLKDDVKQSSKVPEPEPDGSITRLREERRDLYDLLYGDEEEGNGSSNSGESATSTVAPLASTDPPRNRRRRKDDHKNEEESNLLGSGLLSSGSMASLLEDDGDLDDFDPYGLSNY